MYLLKDKIYPLWLLCILMFSLNSTAQLYPLSNQYIYNPVALNPAHSGEEDALSISGQYRKQWVGVNGAPTTMSMTIHAPTLNNKVNFGFQLLRDNYGVHNTTYLSGNYAYRIKMDQSSFSFGIALKAEIIQDSWNSLVAVEADDQQLETSNDKVWKPNFGFGTSWISDNYFIGFSIPQLLINDYCSEFGDYKPCFDISKYSYFSYGGYRIKLNEDFDLYPSVLVKYSPFSGVQMDVSPQIIIKQKLKLAITYRTTGEYSGFVQFQINNQSSFAYSYDFESSKNFQHSGGSHEIMLKYSFKYDLQVESPR